MRRIAIAVNACLVAALCVPLAAAGPPHGHGVNHLGRSMTPARIMRILERTEITVEFDRTPVRDVLRHLEVVTGLRIRAHLDARLDGLDPQTPVTLFAQGETTRYVLEDVLEQCGDPDPCAWQIRRGRLEIGTKTRLARYRQVRAYPVRELLMDVPQFDNAPGMDIDAALNQGATGGGGGSGGGSGGFGGGGGGRGGGGGGGAVIIDDPGAPPARASGRQQAIDIMDLLRETIEPDAWVVNGGTWASISYHQGTLIVSAPPFIHRRIRGR